MLMGKRLHIANLSEDTTVEDLKKLFSTAGNITELSIATDDETGLSKGFASIEMETDASARNAVSDLDRHMLNGRAIRVGMVNFMVGNQKPAKAPKSGKKRAPARKQSAKRR